jgi:hypothetical protein
MACLDWVELHVQLGDSSKPTTKVSKDIHPNHHFGKLGSLDLGSRDYIAGNKCQCNFPCEIESLQPHIQATGQGSVHAWLWPGKPATCDTAQLGKLSSVQNFTRIECWLWLTPQVLLIYNALDNVMSL